MDRGIEIRLCNARNFPGGEAQRVESLSIGAGQEGCPRSGYVGHDSVEIFFWKKVHRSGRSMRELKGVGSSGRLRLPDSLFDSGGGCAGLTGEAPL
jgi:hypothetical protein